jgi:protein SCO1
MSEAVAYKPSRFLRVATPIMLLLAVGSFVAALVLPLPWAKKEPTPEPFVVPPFALTERSGKPVSNADLTGKVWVAAFVFTRCSGPCPSVSATMARLQSELDLANQPDLRLVTFTVDPDRDTPDELKKYADHFRAHPDRWLFLTGKEAELHRLARDGFKIAADRTQNPKPEAGQEFDHSTKLAVVDKKGHVRGYYDGYPGKHDEGRKGYEESVAELKKAVAGLLKE